MRALATLSVAIWVLLGMSACAKKQPTSRPVLVEDVLPFGTDVCFPTGVTNTSPDVGGTVDDIEPVSPLRTEDHVPEVFTAPTTQPTSFSEQEQAWIVEHRDELSASTSRPLSYNTPPSTMPAAAGPLIPEVIHVPATQPASRPTSSEAIFENWPREGVTRPN